MNTKTFGVGLQVISESFCCERLIISTDADLRAPEGKYLALTVNGATLAVKPGEYQGDITMSVASYYIEEPYPSVNRGSPIELETAVCVVDGIVSSERSVPAAITGGSVTGNAASDFYLGANRENFGGITVDGNTDYTVNHARIELEGMGLNDFVGMGAGVTALGDSHVTVNDCDIGLASVTRCAVHAGGKSMVTVNNSRLSNYSPDAELGAWSWGISVRGTNRLCQLADDAEVHYNGCTLTNNGWGVLSVDGSNYAKMFVKDSKLTLTGPRSHGYGIFCIGPTPVEIDHTTIDVNGFPIMMMSMERKGSVVLKNGSLLTGRRYGIHLTSDGGGKVMIRDSAIQTAKSAIVAKHSNTDILMDNVEIRAGNGVILQMMDTDDPGLAGDFIDVSMYETMEDTYMEGRDLTKADRMKDLTVTIRNSVLSGDFLNSSTNLMIRASKEVPAGIPKRPGIVPPGRLAGSIPSGDAPGGPPPMLGMDEGGPPAGMPEMGPLGPKNLLVRLENATLNGKISAAKQHYRSGLRYIDETTREELCNVTQTPAEAVNNGVIVELGEGAVWNPVGISYLTSLTITEGACFCGKLFIDGSARESVPGVYTGKLRVEEN